MINFTFIIPHKNTPDLLQKCIDSIPHRDDVQIIVVDDNSNPDKVDFDKFPGKDDSSVEIHFTKEGKGAGYARNVGLELAKGKWILFADADDFYLPSINRFLDEKVDSKADIIIWKVTSVNIDTGLKGKRGGNINDYAKEAYETGCYENILLISTPVKGMYSHRMLKENGIKFNECMVGNDVVFSSKAAIHTKKTDIFYEEIYCISEHASFGLKSKNTVKSKLIRFQQETESIKITKKIFKYNTNIHQWYFGEWYKLYKSNKFLGIIFLPAAILADSKDFLKTTFSML